VASSPAPAPAELAQELADAVPGVVLEVPFPACAKYAQREVWLTLRQDHATTLRRIFEGLELRHARLASGAQVKAPQDAIRWLLEAVAAKAGPAP
jgi:hypothetical protein